MTDEFDRDTDNGEMRKKELDRERRNRQRKENSNEKEELNKEIRTREVKDNFRRGHQNKTEKEEEEEDMRQMNSNKDTANFSALLGTLGLAVDVHCTQYSIVQYRMVSYLALSTFFSL